MWITFLLLAIAATIVLLFHVSIELNKVDKAVNDMTETLRKHYEP